MSNELSILIETLQKKEEVLKEILSKSKEQLDIVKADEFDEDAYEQFLFEQKLIRKMK